MLTSTLDAYVAFVARCLALSEKCERHRKKRYTDTYWTMMETARRQLIGSVRDFRSIGLERRS